MSARQAGCGQAVRLSVGVFFENGCQIKLPTVYNPPQFNKKQFNGLLDNIFSENFSSNTPTMLTGFFNFDDLKAKKNTIIYECYFF